MATQGYTWVVPVLGCTPFVTLTVLSVLVFGQNEMNLRAWPSEWQYEGFQEALLTFR